MKKIFLFFALAGMAVFTGCNNDDDVDSDTISEVFEINGVDFFAADNYTVVVPLNPPIFSSDVVLVYRRVGSSQGNPIWRLLPQTYFFPEGELEYITDFTVNDVSINIDSDFNLGLVPEFTQNQTFRIVIVPGYFSNTVDVNNYDAVMSALEAGGQEVTVIER